MPRGGMGGRRGGGGSDTRSGSEEERGRGRGPRAHSPAFLPVASQTNGETPEFADGHRNAQVVELRSCFQKLGPRA